MHFQFHSFLIFLKSIFPIIFLFILKVYVILLFCFNCILCVQQDYFCIYLFEFVMHQLIFLLFLRKREKEEKEARKNTRKGEEKEEGNWESEGERERERDREREREGGRE